MAVGRDEAACNEVGEREGVGEGREREGQGKEGALSASVQESFI